MINDATRIIRRWLEHEKYGVNALLPQIPREPHEPGPLPVQLYDDVDDEAMVKGVDTTPPKLPAYVVALDADAEAPVVMNRPQSELKLFAFLAFVVDATMNESQARQQAGIVHKAGFESLLLLNQPKASKGYRQVGVVQLLEVKSMVEQRTDGKMGQGFVPSHLVVEVRAARLPILSPIP